MAKCPAASTLFILKKYISRRKKLSPFYLAVNEYSYYWISNGKILSGRLVAFILLYSSRIVCFISIGRHTVLRMNEDQKFLRAYTVNRQHTGSIMLTHMHSNPQRPTLKINWLNWLHWPNLVDQICVPLAHFFLLTEFCRIHMTYPNTKNGHSGETLCGVFYLGQGSITHLPIS